MSSLYLRGEVWWGKSKEQGKVVRWSLKTTNKAEAKRRLKLYDSQPRPEPISARVKSRVTWDTTATALLEYYRDFGTRRVPEATKQVHTLTWYFGGWTLAAIDTAAVQRYLSHERSKGLAAATVNLRLATLRKALRLAYERDDLEKLPVIRSLRPAAPRAGFFEAYEFEAVAAQLPPDLELVARLAYVLGWRIESELLPLQWSQVDLVEGTLRLSPGGSKNRDGRVVYLTLELKAGLAIQRSRVLAMEREMGRVIPHAFPQTYGHRGGAQRKDIRRTWQQACEQAGCRGKLKHDLRRTAVPNMVNAGISERVARQITGHRTREIFMRYQIVSPGDLQDAARKIARSVPAQNGAQLPQSGEAPRSQITGSQATHV